jgi:heme-degrading monooxygenase HmoA
MISRHWRGLCKPTKADDYVQHLKSDTVTHLKTLDGFIRAEIHQRNSDESIEFLVVTFWNSMEAVRRFAGSSPDVAVVPEIVADMMIKYDRRVCHYEVSDA